jgi:hypothetical protein
MFVLQNTHTHIYIHTYTHRVVDYMLASQFISVFALVQYGIVAYFLSVEHVRLKLLHGFKKSKISEMLRQGYVKPSTIFEQAELKYIDFKASAKFASTKKAHAMKTTDSNSLFPLRFRKHGKHSNKVAAAEAKKNMMLEMIKIDEAEETSEEEIEKLEERISQENSYNSNNNNNNNKQYHQYGSEVSDYNHNEDSMVRPFKDDNNNPSRRSTGKDELFPSNDSRLSSSDSRLNNNNNNNRASSSSVQPQGERRSDGIHAVVDTSPAPLNTANVSLLLNNKLMLVSSSSSAAGGGGATTRNSKVNSSESNSRRSSGESVNRHSYTSSKASSRRNSINRAKVMLTTFEVMTIAYVKEAFEKFDYEHTGVLTIFELKMVKETQVIITSLLYKQSVCILLHHLLLLI